MALLSSFSKVVRPMLDVVDKLRSLGVSQDGIQLPTIVVIGDQSSGKSSVLESLSGLTFPRGDGIVTRVPLVLRMKSATSTSNDDSPRINISYVPQGSEKTGGVSLTISMRSIEQEIERATAALAGSSKGILNRPITLEVCQPGLPDLTLVDLPGITRVPVEGQPENIYELVTDIIKEYITPDEAVILNVLSAEADFSTNESIVMSQKVDPTGDRTLAVVTKVDRKPEGLKEKVLRNSVRIGLGYVLVRNRTKEEASLKEARDVESGFFRANSELQALGTQMLGVPALADRLTQIQALRVKNSLPGIKAKVAQTLREKEEKLVSLPKAIESVGQASAVAAAVLRDRFNVMKQVMEGDYSLFPDDEELHYAARLHEMFEETGKIVRMEAGNILTQEFLDKCVEVIAESKGVSLPDSINPQAVHTLVKAHVRRLEGTLSGLVDKAFEYGSASARNAILLQCSTGRGIHKFLCSVLEEKIAESRQVAHDFVKRQLAKEQAMAFTVDGYYSSTLEKFRAQISQRKENVTAVTGTTNKAHSGNISIAYRNSPRPMASANDLSILLGKVLLENENSVALDMQLKSFVYFNVMAKRLVDSTAMEIRFLLMHCLLDDMDAAAYDELHSRDLISLLDAGPDVEFRRRQLIDSVERLKKCKDVLADLA